MPGAGFVPARAWASPDRSPRPDGRGIVRPVARVFRVRWCPGVGRRRRIPSCDDVRPAVGVRLRPRVRRVVCASVGASSSVGQSTRLISVGSEVQVLPGPYRPVRRGVCGGVAQPGEHLLCTQGVAGSNPAVSIRVPRLRVPRCAGVRVSGRVRRRGVFGPWIGAVVLFGRRRRFGRGRGESSGSGAVASMVWGGVPGPCGASVWGACDLWTSESGSGASLDARDASGCLRPPCAVCARAVGGVAPGVSAAASGVSV